MTTNPEAIRFWNDAINYAYLPMIAVFTWEDINSKYDIDTYDQAEVLMDQYLRNDLGYSATYDEILAAFEETHSSSLSTWNGYYFLFDAADEYHILTVNDDAIQFQVYDSVEGYKKFVPIPATDYTFQGSTLTLTGDISGSLTFSMPTQPDILQDPGVWLSSRKSYQRQCAGTVTLNTNTPDATTLNLMGKVGCYTPVGARNSDRCDPIDRWMGQYNAMAATLLPGGGVNAVHPDAGLTISQQSPGDPNSPIVVTLPTVLAVLDQSTLVISEYRLFNNAISWDDTLYGDTAGQLIFALQLDGTPTLSGTISVDEQDWYVQAHLRPPSPSTVHPAITPTALRTLDVQADPNALSITTTSVDLPFALIGTAYPAFTLQASGGQAPYTWSNATDLPKGLTLSTDGKLSGTPAVDKKGGYTCSITVTDNVKATVSEDLILTILDEVLTIATTALLDATVYDDYQFMIDATGGDPKTYKWTSTDNLPGGLVLDPAQGKISGKATEAGGTGGGSYNMKITLESTVSGKTLTTNKTFTLKVVAAFAPKDLMAMITACFNIFVGGGILKMYLDASSKKKKDAKDAKKGGTDKTNAVADFITSNNAVKEFIDEANRAHQEMQKIKEAYTSQGKITEFQQKFGDTQKRAIEAKNMAITLEEAAKAVSLDKDALDTKLKTLKDEISNASGDALKELQDQLVAATQDRDQKLQELTAANARLQTETDRANTAETDNKQFEETLNGLYIEG